MTSGIDPWDLGPPSTPLPDPPPAEEPTNYTPASSSPVVTKQVDDLTSANGPTSMAPMATKTFNELLAIGVNRPLAPADLVEELIAKLSAGVAPALAAWPEPTLRLGKSAIVSVSKCEGLFVAQRATPFSPDVSFPAAVGTVTHRAIQMSYTHPDLSPMACVRSSVSACRTDERFETFWTSSGPGVQSDVLSTSLVRLTAFLDSWPMLLDEWHPRFEESLSARVEGLVVSGRPDLVLGRPRGDGRQTMLVCDFKSGGLHDEHILEADFYALLVVLRHRVIPWRSFVFSLESGEWTDPDVTPERLFATVDRIVSAANNVVETLSEARLPVLIPGQWCRWCPVSETCKVSLFGPNADDSAVSLVSASLAASVGMILPQDKTAVDGSKEKSAEENTKDDVSEVKEEPFVSVSSNESVDNVNEVVKKS